MHRIYIETVAPKEDKKTNEYRFFEYLFKEVLKKEVEIIPIGGKTNLKDYDNQLKDSTKNGFKNIVIVDADGKWNTKDWTFQSEKQKIETLKEELGVEFDLFLMPNDQDEGDFEMLLEKIVNHNHRKILDCHLGFEDCIKESEDYVTPNRKARIYSYITSFKRSQKEHEDFKNKGNWFFENQKYWDFKAIGLEDLKRFLRNNL